MASTASFRSGPACARERCGGIAIRRGNRASWCRACQAAARARPRIERGLYYRGGVRLPFDPPIEPMLAKPADALPEGDGWLFEPKWDGFRALVFRDGDETLIQSRDLKPLDRYF